MDDADLHFSFQLTADQRIQAFGVVALDPEHDGESDNLAGGELVNSALCHDRRGIKFHGAGLGTRAVTLGLGIGGGGAVHVQSQADGVVQTACDVGHIHRILARYGNLASVLQIITTCNIFSLILQN